jgi:hypothetical protein
MASYRVLLKKGKTMIEGKVETTLNKLKGKIHYIDIPPIDKTLTKEGQCADAKAVGDAFETVEGKFKEVNTEISDLHDEIKGTNVGGIVEKVSSGNLSLSNSNAGGLKVLNLYGKSEQGENPSPDNVQPIVSAGQMLIDGVVSDVGINKKVIGEESYTEQNLTINRVLRGIPVTDSSLANYTDENGQMWCADYGDVERKVWVQRIGAVDLSTLTWDHSARWEQTTVADLKYVANNTQIGVALCENYSIRKASGLSTSVLGELAIDTTNIKVANGGATHEPSGIMFYMLATPIETPMTDEEIIALHSLKTNNGVTHITSDNVPDAPMLVKYGTSEVGALSLENGNLHVVNRMLVEEINSAIPFRIEIDDEAETINFIDRNVGQTLGTSLEEIAKLVGGDA